MRQRFTARAAVVGDRAGTVVPEGARVSVLETRGTLARILWGGTEAWVQASTIRLLASA